MATVKRYGRAMLRALWEGLELYGAAMTGDHETYAALQRKIRERAT